MNPGGERTVCDHGKTPPNTLGGTHSAASIQTSRLGNAALRGHLRRFHDLPRITKRHRRAAPVVQPVAQLVGAERPQEFVAPDRPPVTRPSLADPPTGELRRQLRQPVDLLLLRGVLHADLPRLCGGVPYAPLPATNIRLFAPSRQQAA